MRHTPNLRSGGWSRKKSAMQKHITWLAVGFLALAAVPAAATSERLTPALFLARVAVNEAGWASYETGDMQMIHEAFARGAARQGVSYLAYATHYSQRVAGLRPTTSGRIAWTMNLLPSGSEPQNWPRYISRRGRPGEAAVLDPHPAWTNWRSSWLETYRHAQEVSSWPIATVAEWSVCDREVHDWGSPRLDRARAERMGLAEIECSAPPEVQPVEISVPPEQDSQRLDRVLVGLWPGAGTASISQTTFQRWVRIGRVTVDGEVADDHEDRVTAGQLLVVRPAPLNDSWARPWLLANDEDEDEAADEVDVD